MKDAQKNSFGPWTNDPGMAVKYAPIHGMVTELLVKIEPDGYAEMLEGLRDEWKPVGVEDRVIEMMADLSWRIRGCFYLDTEILKQGMEACGPDVASDVALGRAFVRDFEGPNLLDKLSRYQSRLSKEFSRCLRLLRLSTKNRKYAEARTAATRDKLAKSKPCTSVIQ